MSQIGIGRLRTSSPPSFRRRSTTRATRAPRANGGSMSRAVVMAAAVGAVLLGPAQKPAAAQGPRNPGTSEVCGRFAVAVINGGIFGDYEFTAPDEGWAYVNPDRKRVEATGIAHAVQVAGE